MNATVVSYSCQGNALGEVWFPFFFFYKYILSIIYNLCNTYMHENMYTQCKYEVMSMSVCLGGRPES